MARFKFKVPDEIASLIRGLHPQIKATIRMEFQTILEDPYIGKPLKDELAGFRSYRVKRYRIIYQILPA